MTRSKACGAKRLLRHALRSSMRKYATASKHPAKRIVSYNADKDQQQAGYSRLDMTLSCIPLPAYENTILFACRLLRSLVAIHVPSLTAKFVPFRAYHLPQLRASVDFLAQGSRLISTSVQAYGAKGASEPDCRK